MAAASDKLEANRRHARLAIAWFAVDPVQVEKLLRAAQERQRAGAEVDFLAALQEARILTAEQVERLRVDANGADTDEPRVTKLDVNGAAGEPACIGPYRILRKLGQGGMGAVYLGYDAKDNRQVAVKVLAADQASKPNILRRFLQEGRHGALLVHVNIVRSFDMGQDPATGLHYIVLEYIDGPSAHDLLDRLGKLHVADAIHVVLDIARALEHAHKNQIIHRDIKPANILITSAGLAKLSDLGLAKRRDDSANLTNADQGIGTPYYVPYEQAMNAKKADERSDIYALGATLYHLVTGEVPFSGDSSLEIVEKKGVGVYRPARAVNPDVPDKLDAILARMLARDPADRYQTASEVIVELERSELAAAIPSFVNVDVALQDPVVQQRLTSPVEATQPDLQLQKHGDHPKAPKAPTIWFLRYTDQRGNLCKAKGTAGDVIERLKRGTIPRDAEASRSPNGPFRPIATWPEFAKAAVPIAKKAEASEARQQHEDAAADMRWQTWWWIAAGAVGIIIVVMLIVTVLLIAAPA
ncbi:MAG: serine/threonine protein kinase [Planctomycetes bacterium]|nr:serine/threonine protein kinase [Planctomycetota bacterium]